MAPAALRRTCHSRQHLKDHEPPCLRHTAPAPPGADEAEPRVLAAYAPRVDVGVEAPPWPTLPGQAHCASYQSAGEPGTLIAEDRAVHVVSAGGRVLADEPAPDEERSRAWRQQHHLFTWPCHARITAGPGRRVARVVAVEKRRRVVVSVAHLALGVSEQERLGKVTHRPPPSDPGPAEAMLLQPLAALGRSRGSGFGWLCCCGPAQWPPHQPLDPRRVQRATHEVGQLLARPFGPATILEALGVRVPEVPGCRGRDPFHRVGKRWPPGPALDAGTAPGLLRVLRRWRGPHLLIDLPGQARRPAGRPPTCHRRSPARRL